MNVQNMTTSDIYFSIMAVSGFLIVMILYLINKKRPKKKNDFLFQNASDPDGRRYIKKRPRKKNDFLDEIINRQKNNEEILYKKLLSMVFGSRDTAERLIRMEQGRIPNLSRINSIKAAIDRILQDRQ